MNYRGVRKTDILIERATMESDGEKVMASLPSVGRVTKASRMPKRAKGVFNNAQKIASLARQTNKAHEKRPCCKRGDLLGVVESAGGMNTPFSAYVR